MISKVETREFNLFHKHIPDFPQQQINLIMNTIEFRHRTKATIGVKKKKNLKKLPITETEIKAIQKNSPPMAM